jgi:hypothetical protein
MSLFHDLPNQQEGLEVIVINNQRNDGELLDWRVESAWPATFDTTHKTVTKARASLYGRVDKIKLQVQHSINYLPLQITIDSTLLQVYRESASSKARDQDAEGFACEDGPALEEFTAVLESEAGRLHTMETANRAFDKLTKGVEMAQADRASMNKYCALTFSGFPFTKNYGRQRLRVLRTKVLVEAAWAQAGKDPARSAASLLKLFAGSRNELLKVSQDYFEARDQLRQFDKNPYTVQTALGKVWGVDCQDSRVREAVLQFDTKKFIGAVLGAGCLELAKGDDTRDACIDSAWKKGWAGKYASSMFKYLSAAANGAKDVTTFVVD